MIEYLVQDATGTFFYLTVKSIELDSENPYDSLTYTICKGDSEVVFTSNEGKPANPHFYVFEHKSNCKLQVEKFTDKFCVKIYANTTSK